MGNKQRQGLSNRQYGKHAGVSAPYVQKLVNAGKIPVLPDGSLDPVACDAARARNTIMGRGQRRQGKDFEQALGGYAECIGCGEEYPLIASRNLGTPKFEQFCTANCQADHERGLSRATIRRRIFKEANA
ncbi:MAG: hypothetical protein ACLPN2_04430 [Terriglobales bacterium]